MFGRTHVAVGAPLAWPIRWCSVSWRS